MKVTNGSFDQWLATIENHRHSIDRTNKGRTIGIQSMAMVGSEKTTYHSIGNNCQLEITIGQWPFHRPKNFTTGQAYQSVMILQTKLKFCLVYLLPTPSHCIQVSPGFPPPPTCVCASHPWGGGCHNLGGAGSNKGLRARQRTKMAKKQQFTKHANGNHNADLEL